VTEPSEFDEFRQRQERQERGWRIPIRVMDVLTGLRSAWSRPWSWRWFSS